MPCLKVHTNHLYHHPHPAPITAAASPQIAMKAWQNKYETETTAPEGHRIEGAGSPCPWHHNLVTQDAVLCRPVPSYALQTLAGALLSGSHSISLLHLVIILSSEGSFWPDFMPAPSVLDLCQFLSILTTSLHGIWYCPPFRDEEPGSEQLSHCPL